MCLAKIKKKMLILTKYVELYENIPPKVDNGAATPLVDRERRPCLCHTRLGANVP